MKGSKKLNRVLLGLEMVNGDVIIKILLRFICVYYTSIICKYPFGITVNGRGYFPIYFGFFCIWDVSIRQPIWDTRLRVESIFDYKYCLFSISGNTKSSITVPESKSMIWRWSKRRCNCALNQFNKRIKMWKTSSKCLNLLPYACLGLCTNKSWNQTN